MDKNTVYKYMQLCKKYDFNTIFNMISGNIPESSYQNADELETIKYVNDLGKLEHIYNFYHDMKGGKGKSSKSKSKSKSKKSKQKKQKKQKKKDGDGDGDDDYEERDDYNNRQNVSSDHSSYHNSEYAINGKKIAIYSTTKAINEIKKEIGDSNSEISKVIDDKIKNKLNSETTDDVFEKYLLKEINNPESKIFVALKSKLNEDDNE